MTGVHIIDFDIKQSFNGLAFSCLACRNNHPNNARIIVVGVSRQQLTETSERLAG